ncbi:accessory Sec system protein Asp2 [Oenococcus sp. UCMA 17063]|nr:accessory Sec system protein Asp2 [Oenococcus sp. UCMA 17063]
MNKLINVLQIGNKDWQIYLNGENKKTNWIFLNSDENDDEGKIDILSKKFDIYLFTSQSSLKFLKELFSSIPSYHLLYNSNLLISNDVSQLLKIKKSFSINIENPIEILNIIENDFSGKQLGAKLDLNRVEISSDFKGKIAFNGHVNISLDGFFGERFSQLLLWQYNIPFDKQFDYELWPEFETSPNVSIELRISEIKQQSSNVIRTLTIPQSKLNSPFILKSSDQDIYAFFSIYAHGSGYLKIGPLHYRKSRHSFGQLIVGGRRFSDSSREELLTYFDPGDLRPPLNVYFSGYRTAEGFEGYPMMKSLGSPFLLIADPRIEGGSFYLGSEELERFLHKKISNCLKELDFKANQLILSGLSMGSFGALYYGSDFKADAIIVGKPLVNLGNIAKNEKLVRPGGFPTSLDILNFLTNDNYFDRIKRLNERFWKKFNQADLNNTRLAISYMLNDDYDPTAYRDILAALKNKKTSLIGKGIPGRHNDNSQAINDWFIRQFKNILAADFQRGKKNGQ